MNLFFDTEFTGLYKDTELISIGVVDENGRKFYGEINTIDIDSQDDWIKENVLLNTVYYGDKDINEIGLDVDYFAGNKYEIAEALKEWLKAYDNIQFISDVCHYDFVLLIDLFGTAFDLPENVNASCHDINQDIANYYYIDEYQAFNLNREDILNDFDNLIIDGNKHNSLYDAEVIKNIYDLIH